MQAFITSSTYRNNTSANHKLSTSRHGRDNNLRIWQLRSSDEATLSTTLPAEDSKAEQPKPWLLHTLPVNTLNFCAFSMCYEHEPQGQHSSTRPSNGSILIATPSTDDKKINIYQFPEEKLKYVVPKASTADTGKSCILTGSIGVPKYLLGLHGSMISVTGRAVYGDLSL